MVTKVLSELSESQKKDLTQRPSIDYAKVFETTRWIVDDVKARGDLALRDFTKRFDQIDLTTLKVEESEIRTAEKKLPKDLVKAFRQAASNIEKFHASQLRKEKAITTMPGVTCFRENRAIEKVGLYIPGGTAVLPSTVLMLAIPAKLAGCKEIIMISPPQKNGSLSSEILFAANISGVTKICMSGGAQAIAALAYGTETIPKVDKIFGPGNQYVTAAKMIVSTDAKARVAIDMPAGPSEVLVMADKKSNPAFVAADLLSQAEHGVDSQVVLVTTDRDMAKAVEAEVKQQVAELPRKEIILKALEKSLIVLSPSLEEAFAFSNQYAPEHLILQIENPEKYIALIQNAGSVFLGPWSPESVGDYASGTNHTLPTYGYARNYSGVSVDSFLKKITFQKLTQKGLQNIGRTVELMAECEGLQAHKNAVSIRLLTL